jgi:hypothetical protein
MYYQSLTLLSFRIRIIYLGSYTCKTFSGPHSSISSHAEEEEEEEEDSVVVNG